MATAVEYAAGGATGSRAALTAVMRRLLDQPDEHAWAYLATANGASLSPAPDAAAALQLAHGALDTGAGALYWAVIVRGSDGLSIAAEETLPSHTQVAADPWAATQDPPVPGVPPSFDQPLSINQQTDQMFYAAHPELRDRRLDPRRAGDAGLIREWLAYRDFLVAAPVVTRPGSAIASAAQAFSSGAPMNSPDPWSRMQSSPPYRHMYAPSQAHTTVLGALGHKPTPEGWGAYRKRKGLLLDVAPVLHPPQDVRVELSELDPQNVLRVVVTVDKRSYRAAIDLTAAIALVMDKLAKWHRREHKLMSQHMLVGRGSPRGRRSHSFSAFTEAPDESIDQAVGAAADALVGKLINEHIGVVCGNFLDDIGHALSSVGTKIVHGLQDTLKVMKPVIEAGAVAGLSALGVPPQVSQMATKLVGPLVDTVSNAGRPHPVVQAAQKAAQTDPNVAAALNAAKVAAAKAVATAHVVNTAQLAQQGHPLAQQQMQQVQQSAQAGDQLAQQLLGQLGQFFGFGGGGFGGGSAPASAPLPPPDPAFDPSLIEIDPPDAPAVSGEALIGAAIEELRREGSARARARAAGGRGALLVVIDGSGGYEQPYASVDEADDHFGQLDPTTFIYAAYYDPQDPTFPAPVNERMGAIVHQTPGAAAVSGAPLLPALLGMAAGAGGMAAWDRRAAIKAWFAGTPAAA
jgi:hypothetical protein